MSARRPVAIPARLLGTGSATAGRAWSTEELAREALPHRDAGELARRVGIDKRYRVETGGATELATKAVARALAAADLPATALRRLVLATSTGGDHLIPSTAHSVVAAIGAAEECDAFDVNNSCVGFLTALEIAAMSAHLGRGPVAVVAVEVFSRYVAPERPRPYLVLGDAAAACIVGAGGPGEGIVASDHRSREQLRGRLVTAHPGVTGERAVIDFTPSAAEMTRSAVDGMRVTCETVLATAGIGLDAVDWFLPHQPNGEMLAEVTARFGVGPDRMVPIVRDVGSVGAASVPTSLDRLFRTKEVAPGARILLTGVGSGTAASAVLWQVAS